MKFCKRRLKTKTTMSEPNIQPPLVTRDVTRDVAGAPNQASLVACIEWFLERDARVNIIRHPAINELFGWKQTREGESPETFEFASAEDRLAIGIFQAVSNNNTEKELHAWITDLLVALDDAAKTNEAITDNFNLDTNAETPALERATQLPDDTARDVYLTACWLETLCTAEARVLGWVYQCLYGRAFQPNNFA